MEINPYAPSAGRLEDASQTAEAERIRTTHINHEASILLVGLLYYLGGALAILGGVGALGNDLRDWRFGMAMPFILIGVPILTGIGIMSRARASMPGRLELPPVSTKPDGTVVSYSERGSSSMIRRRISSTLALIISFKS